MAALVGAIGYFVYKIVRIYQAKDLYQQVFKVSTRVHSRMRLGTESLGLLVFDDIRGRIDIDHRHGFHLVVHCADAL